MEIKLYQPINSSNSKFFSAEAQVWADSILDKEPNQQEANYISLLNHWKEEILDGTIDRELYDSIRAIAKDLFGQESVILNRCKIMTPLDLSKEFLSFINNVDIDFDRNNWDLNDLVMNVSNMKFNNLYINLYHGITQNQIKQLYINNDPVFDIKYALPSAIEISMKNILKAGNKIGKIPTVKMWCWNDYFNSLTESESKLRFNAEIYIKDTCNAISLQDVLERSNSSNIHLDIDSFTIQNLSWYKNSLERLKLLKSVMTESKKMVTLNCHFSHEESDEKIENFMKDLKNL